MGGHAREILKGGANVLGIDWDEEAVRALPDPAVKVVVGNYADIKRIAEENDFVPVDGIILDLGLSMWQIRESGRGFSYEKDDELLDMRLSNLLSITASDIVNSYSLEELYEIFSKYSEEVNSWPIIRSLDRFRRMKRIMTVGELKEAIRIVTKSDATLARVFQALRMKVNHELENIRSAIINSYEILIPGGRLAVITFHPTEDRLIKRLIREQGYKGVRTRRIRAPQSFERSAQLRVITKNI
ncbi:16S rRNA (cytosine(1402)-N(4))-methyltransferase [Candidatus Roizmanbacteria bacterium RIFCSPHIGHO2_02_FULL_43_11]|nr:MAG: 16S rRNA (cytosine(1402)-N(4))-methyltransferase [Candidatus Roizmanbacteria bacterium RIFCSPHIGHO2_02_FULL_43_11]